MKIYKHILFTAAFSATVFCSKAQTAGNTDYYIWNLNAADTTYVFGNMANVRTAPDLTATIQDSLLCGTMIIIKEKETKVDAVKGIYAPWVKVQYFIDGKDRDGYLWMGLLPLGNYQEDDLLFLYGIDRIVAKGVEADGYQPPGDWNIKAKAVEKSGRIIDEYEWAIKEPEITVTQGKLLGDMGLENIADILRLQFGGEACGIPTNYFYLGWTGNKFVALPGKTEVGDAGVYYHTETFLFPKEQGGMPGKIIKLTEEGEAGEQLDKNGDPIFKITKSRTVFKWDGKKAIKLK